MSPSGPISDHPLNFAPAIPFLYCPVVDRSSPRLLRSPSPPFPLQAPIPRLSFNGLISFPQCMSYPSPFPSLNLYGYLSFPCPLQSSSFEITSSQWMFRILCKQQLTKVCSFEMVVFVPFHVSDPCNSTNLKLLRKMPSLVLVNILLFFHTG
jgi:hypothetical protein